MRRRAAVAAGLVLAAAAGTGLSGAVMTDGQSAAPSVFHGGTLDLAANTAPGTSGLDATFMRPGQTRQGTLALHNAGTVAAALTAGIADRVDVPDAAALSGVLELKLEDCGADASCATPTTAYDGSLRDFATAPLGNVAGGATRFVRASLIWGATKDDPSRQGATTTATLVWNAVAGSTA